MKPFAKVEKLKDGTLFFTAGEDDSLDHVSRHGEDILDVVKFTGELNIAHRARVREELKALKEKISVELEIFRDGGKLKNGDDIADLITRYVNDERCSSFQSEKRRLLTDLEGEFEDFFTQCAESVNSFDIDAFMDREEKDEKI